MWWESPIVGSSCAYCVSFEFEMDVMALRIVFISGINVGKANDTRNFKISHSRVVGRWSHCQENPSIEFDKAIAILMRSLRRIIRRHTHTTANRCVAPNFFRVCSTSASLYFVKVNAFGIYEPFDPRNIHSSDENLSRHVSWIGKLRSTKSSRLAWWASYLLFW